MEKPETRGIMYTLERCGNTESTNAKKGSACSLVSRPQRLARFPLSGGREGDDQNLYMEVGAQLNNLIGGSQHVS
jgi:hypothetical protein